MPERGLNAGDRVRVRAKGLPERPFSTPPCRWSKQGEIGIFTEAMKELKNPDKPWMFCQRQSLPPSATSRIMMDKQKLNEDQIRTIVQDIVDNNLSEIELSAYVTASYIHNMDSQETEWLTRAMIETGEEFTSTLILSWTSTASVAFPATKSLC